MSEPFVIRPAMAADLDDMGRLGATLVSTHHRFDPRRFMAPRPQADVGYARFLGSQLTEPDTLLLVADCAGRVAGYVYATLEPTSWVELRDACGYVHDVVVDAPSQRLNHPRRSPLVAVRILHHSTNRPWLEELEVVAVHRPEGRPRHQRTR